MAEVPAWRRPDRATPSAWEADLLERRRLTLPTLESCLPLALITAEGFIGAGAGGDPMCSVYSRSAFETLLANVDLPAPSLDAYILPHLPLRDAAALEGRLAAGTAEFRIHNMPLLQAKMNARAKLLRVRYELGHLKGPVEVALTELVTRRGMLAPILEAEADTDFGAAAVVPLDTAGADELLAAWKVDLQEKRDLATAARRRVILAVHLALLSDLDEGAVGDDVHSTILRLAPELHERIFGNAKHSDPCSELPHHGDADWERREKRTSIALQQLMREVGIEMKPKEFINISLEQSRRYLIKLEGDLTHRELCLNILQSLQDAAVALSSLRRLDHELHAHLSRPTLLGCKVSVDEMPTTDRPFFPNLDGLSEEDLRKAVRRELSSLF